MWVMVSGINCSEDASNALKLGANAFGLVVEQGQALENSFLSPEVATSITKSLNTFPKSLGRMESLGGSVLVTHITDVQKIIHLASMIGVTIIQLVGDTTSEDIAAIKNKLPYIKVIKSLPIMDDSCIRQVKGYIDIVDAIELDTFDTTTKRTGGTGKTHDWNISKKIVEEYGWKVPIILAGGLHSANIEKAIQTVKPVGVDVSSGIKTGKSIQDSEKLEAFIYKARQCAHVLDEQSGPHVMYP